MGDFNVIKSLEENLGGDDHWVLGMEDFKTTASSLFIDDIRAIGPLLTWWDGQDPPPIGS